MSNCFILILQVVMYYLVNSLEALNGEILPMWKPSGYCGYTRIRVALAPLPICSLTLTSIPTSNYSPRLTPCIQSHYREVTRWKILMEQKLRFWLSLGSTENTCILLPNKSKMQSYQFTFLLYSLCQLCYNWLNI